MSRIGKEPIPIPSGVEVKLDGQKVTVKGPKGELTDEFHEDMAITVDDGEVRVERPSDERDHRSLHGLCHLECLLSSYFRPSQRGALTATAARKNGVDIG